MGFRASEVWFLKTTRRMHLYRTALSALFLFIAVTAGATIFGSVRGIIHDPQHRPVSDDA